MATLENIQAKIVRLQTEAAAIVKKQSLAAIAKISDLMQSTVSRLSTLNRKLAEEDVVGDR